VVGERNLPYFLRRFVKPIMDDPHLENGGTDWIDRRMGWSSSYRRYN